MSSAIRAMAEREVRKELADLGKLFFDVAWPLMILMVLGFGVDAFAHPRADLSYVAFLGPGVLGLLFARRCVSYSRSLIHDARSGFREYLVAPIHQRWIVLGSITGAWIVHSAIALLVLAGYLIFISVTLEGLLYAIAGVLASTAAALSIALVISIIFKDAAKLAHTSSLVIMLLVLVSGIFFPIENLPFSLSFISFFSPLTYMTDSIRGPLVGVSHSAPLTGLAVTIIIAVVCLAVGIWKSHSLFRM